METQLSDQNNNNILIRFGNGIISFVVGVSAFFVIKLVLMIPFNIIVAQQNIERNPGNMLEEWRLDEFETNVTIMGFVVILACIYFSTKYSQKLNRVETRKTRNIMRAITIAFGLVCMIISSFAIQLFKFP